MSGKKKAASTWKLALLGLSVTAAVELAGCLLTALLAVRGVLPEERLLPPLAVTALCASLLGGLATGKGRPTAALLNAALFGGLLVLVGYGVWDCVSPRGLLLLGMVTAGGVAAAVLRGKVGKRHGKRLVRFNKNAHFS